jgi:ribosomal protein S27E
MGLFSQTKRYREHLRVSKDHGIILCQDQWQSYFHGNCPICHQYQEVQGPASQDLTCPQCQFLLVSREGDL